jgi:uncharacterized radical SAM superfamily Fe-S cluster-containing enzyme
MPVRNYTYYDFTVSLCPECLKRIDTKIVFEDGKVYMLKTCPDHGFFKVVIATDIEYYKNTRNYNKPSETPLKFNTAVHYGCPYDCGLCTDHEQHSCLTLVEITDRCNLACPTCYAMSSPHYGRHRTVEEVERMLDIIVANEGEPDVVQISGGEPTIHPQFFEILEACANQLPVSQGRLFLMREWLELSSEEICKELNLSTTNLYVQLHRARLRLRECLELKWFMKGPAS